MLSFNQFLQASPLSFDHELELEDEIQFHCKGNCTLLIVLLTL